ncbi:TetR/AcrR family transcriptional regulator [Salinibacterium sp. SYSU T00001]|uniref:TetR/AcrR family transcriptional regulator n=1 Tax=Homoserinimonas sedimenticola TaxID=2986805 RepID=UPI00223604FA|nr:TetR/AcrR family transcriptional regulator [Salinibacterium sedimenticola]MCW4385159.1 TetR/AcrR family transcriptional regulator [Salinibacterium sedimenticola]
MTIHAEPGLRERKRRATRLAIQRAAVELVLEEGLGVTVEEISRRAEVSPRTFFNYFPTKEDALLGSMPPLPLGEERERFVSAGPDADIVDGLTEMLAALPDEDVGETEVYLLRRRMIAAHPELAARRLLTTRSMESQLLEIVEERLVNDSRVVGADAATAPMRARLIAFTAFAVLRSAWMSWVDREGAVPIGGCIRDSFAEARSLFARS